MYRWYCGFLELSSDVSATKVKLCSIKQISKTVKQDRANACVDCSDYRMTIIYANKKKNLNLNRLSTIGLLPGVSIT